MTAPMLTYAHDGCLQTPCLPWCHYMCDGTWHGSSPVDIDVRCHPLPLTINVTQRPEDTEPRVALTDAQCVRVDELTADEAERLANLLLDHVKIARATMA